MAAADRHGHRLSAGRPRRAELPSLVQGQGQDGRPQGAARPAGRGGPAGDRAGERTDRRRYALPHRARRRVRPDRRGAPGAAQAHGRRHGGLGHDGAHALHHQGLRRRPRGGGGADGGPGADGPGAGLLHLGALPARCTGGFAAGVADPSGPGAAAGRLPGDGARGEVLVDGVEPAAHPAGRAAFTGVLPEDVPAADRGARRAGGRRVRAGGGCVRAPAAPQRAERTGASLRDRPDRTDDARRSHAARKAPGAPTSTSNAPRRSIPRWTSGATSPATNERTAAGPGRRTVRALSPVAVTSR